MTYDEIKSRLVRVETALQSIKTGDKSINKLSSEKTLSKLKILKE